jgi:hypothetical protein
VGSVVVILFKGVVFQNRINKTFVCLQANIHSIMASEDQVLELMTLIDEGLKEACSLEEQLDVYNQKLQVWKVIISPSSERLIMYPPPPLGETYCCSFPVCPIYLHVICLAVHPPVCLSHFGFRVIT